MTATKTLPTLSTGDTGPDVRWAQYRLVRQTLSYTDVDGVFGPVTYRGVVLFQESYENLGYPDKYFNDRLVEVIDHLLATPTPNGPVKLIQPRVFYEYADPALEQLSAGQKVLIRMGNANAAQLKKKMREFRALIAKGPPSDPGDPE